MEKVIKIKDGTEVFIRNMSKEDLEKSLAFFQALPAEDRRYLRRDVTKRAVVAERINAMQSGRVKRLVALLNDEIIAEGSLELETREWKKHIGEIRLLVARSFQRQGLGRLMARELYFLALSGKIEELVVKIMRPQVRACSIFTRLGFVEDIALGEYVKDQTGAKQDLILMRCELQALMKEMEDHMADSDWERSR
jgi:L-amino acid N-acyltransferase YncA